MKIPKVDMPMKEENGRYFCLSEDCATKGQSFQWINGLREHFMDKESILRNSISAEKFSDKFLSSDFGHCPPQKQRV
jgi:hypothetical protein